MGEFIQPANETTLLAAACSHQIVVHSLNTLQGAAALHNLMSCGAAVLLLSGDDNFQMLGGVHLTPWLHYVPVWPSCANLEERVRWALQGGRKAIQRIAEYGQKMATVSYSDEHKRGYVRALLAQYAQMQEWRTKRRKDFVMTCQSGT